MRGGDDCKAFRRTPACPGRRLQHLPLRQVAHQRPGPKSPWRDAIGVLDAVHQRAERGRRDGDDVADRVRESLPGREPIYVLLLTIRGRKEDVVRGLESGANDYIVKPFDAAELQAWEERNARLGLATMCVGAGQGIATIFERV